MARHGKTGFLAALVRNPLIIATGLALAANLAGLRIPSWLEPTIARITPDGRQRYLDYLAVLEQVVRDAASAAKGVVPMLRKLKPV